MGLHIVVTSNAEDPTTGYLLISDQSFDPRDLEGRDDVQVWRLGKAGMLKTAAALMNVADHLEDE